MPAARTVSIAVGAVAGVAVLGALAFFVLSPHQGSTPFSPATPEPVQTYAAPAAPPAENATPGVGVATLVDPLWVAETAESTGIPERALAAYAGMAISKARSMPTCGLSWNTLAAIGYVESRHGTHDGSSIGADGTTSPPIFGVELSGGATANIPDSDGGAIDGTAEIDRAVGPLQLIPQTWKNWHVDANGDGIEDPQNIDDAVMATANYLCRSSPDMVGEAGWQAGIAAYNSAPSYLHAVAAAANRYRG